MKRINIKDIPDMDEGDFLERNEPLVHYVLNKIGLHDEYDLTGLNKSDLIACGMLGLLKAKRGFDPSKGYQFSSYAFSMVRGQILSEVSRNSKVYIPRPVREMRRKVKDLEVKGLSKEEVMKELDITATAYDKCTMANIRAYVCYLDAPLKEDTETTLRDTLVSDHFIEEDMIKEDLVSRFLQTLGKKEKDLWVSIEVDGMSQVEASRKYGISQPQASRIMKGVFTKARQFGKGLDNYVEA